MCKDPRSEALMEASGTGHKKTRTSLARVYVL